jgi:hypothetical protein
LGQLRGSVVVGVHVADDATIVEFVDLEHFEALEEAAQIDRCCRW